MHVIKKCGACGRNIRFPIDKGKIKVTCRCGFSFLADPDNKELYQNARFDLHGKKQKSSPNRISEFLKKADLKSAYRTLMKIFYETKYQYQNFSLLTASEQKKLLILAAAVIAVLLVIIFILIHTGSKDLPPEGITI